LHNVKDPQGNSIFKGRRATALSNKEHELAGITDVSGLSLSISYLTATIKLNFESLLTTECSLPSRIGYQEERRNLCARGSSLGGRMCG
jgi:hypothetical protein